MNPAEKYMPKEKYRASDMEFVPFNNTNNNTNTGMGMDMSMNMNNNPNISMGWIPIYFFNNMNIPFTNLVNTLPKLNNLNMNKFMSTSMNTPMSMNAPTSMNVPTSMTPNQLQNLSSYAYEYPDYTNTSALYSYNNNNPNNNSSISNLNTNYSSTMTKSITTNKARSSDYLEPTVIEALREFDLDLNEDIDLVRNVEKNRNQDDYKIEKIFKAIETDNPGTFSLLQAYNVPYPVIKLLIRRVIKLTLTYCKKDGE